MNKIGLFIKKVADVGDVRVKLAIIMFLIGIVSGIIYYRATRFGTSDPIPQIDIAMEDIKQARFFTVRVKTGFLIQNIPLFDEVKNQFLIDAVIWFEFDSSATMLETIEQFSFDNGKILSRSSADVKMRGDNVFAKYNLLIEVKTDLRHYKFPFDDHRLSIILTNNAVTPDEMVFVVDRSSFQIADNIFVSDWRIYDFNVHFGYLRQTIDEQDKSFIVTPKALFMINFAKASMRKIFIVFLPLFAATFLALFSFLLSLSNGSGRFGLGVSGLTAILGYRFVIEQLLPKVGYFTTTDEMYLFLLLFVFIIFVFQLLFTRNIVDISKEKNPAEVLVQFERMNNWMFVSMVLLLLGGVGYILLK